MAIHKSPFRFTDPFKKDRDLIYKHIGFTKKITKLYQYAVVYLALICIIIIQLKKLYNYIFISKSRIRHNNNSFFQIQQLKVHSFLISKPSLPIINLLFNDNKTFISISLYYCINAFVFLYNLPMDDSFNLALRAGLVSGVNIPLLYLIPLKSGPLLYLIDQSYENLIVLHKFIGILVVFMAMVHGAAFSWCLTWDYLFTKIKGQTGFLTLSFFLIISLSSIKFIRTNWYELFYALHLFSFIAFLPIFYHHHYVCKPFVIFVIGCLTFDRSIRWVCKLWIGNCKIVNIDPQDDMLILSIDTSYHKLSRAKKFMAWLLFKPYRHFNWELSNHLFITIPSINLFQSHPFTIANPSSEKTPLLIIKIHNGFTKKLFEKAINSNSKTFTCFIHGPYGNSSIHFPQNQKHDALLEIPFPYHIETQDHNTESSPLLSSSTKKHSFTTTTTQEYQHSKPSSFSSISTIQPKRQKIILISGGAGISFTLPLLQIYHNSPLYDVSFIWIIRSGKPLRQIKFDERDNILVWCTRDQGRPNVTNLLYDSLNNLDYDVINIMACGPNGLIDDIKKFTSFEISKGNHVNLITEEFSF